MKKLLTYLILMIVLPSLHAFAESTKIIKWVDKNGVTQYGDRPPMPNKATKSSVLNKQGVTVQRVELKKTSPKEDKVLADKVRYDNALLASYNSVEEIEIARKRNTKIDTLTIAALEEKKKKLNLQLQKNNKVLRDYAKKNKPAPANTAGLIERDIAAVESLESRIKKRKATIEKINQRYEDDKLRYAELASKKENFNSSNHSNTNIAELRSWRADAQKRLQSYESENLRYIRRGLPVPTAIRDGLVRTTKEVENANKEIAANELAITKNKERLSQ